MKSPPRSDIRLASAERLAQSGQTEEERFNRAHMAGRAAAKEGILLLNLKDQRLTISQHDRAVKLMREIYPERG